MQERVLRTGTVNGGTAWHGETNGSRLTHNINLLILIRF